MGSSILENIPMNNEYTDFIKKYLNYCNINDEKLITTFFSGRERKAVIRDIISIHENISLCRTYRINGRITTLQRDIRNACDSMDIRIETIDINTEDENYKWLNNIT